MKLPFKRAHTFIKLGIIFAEFFLRNRQCTFDEQPLTLDSAEGKFVDMKDIYRYTCVKNSHYVTLLAKPSKPNPGVSEVSEDSE